MGATSAHGSRGDRPSSRQEGDTATAESTVVASAAYREHVPRPALRLVVATLVIVLAIYALWAFRFIVLAALVGVMIGVLPDPILRWLQRRVKLPRGAGALAIALIAALLAVGLGYGVYLTIVPEVERLMQQGPAIAERLNAYKAFATERLAALGVGVEQFDVAGMAQGGLQVVLKGLSVGVDGLAAAVVVVMIAMFVMANQQSYARGALSALPPARRDRTAELGAGAAQVLRRWFGGQMVVTTVSGVLTAVTMALLGVDYWLLIAALTVVLDFVPFIGALITGLVAFLLTVGTEPEKALWVVLAFVAIQQVESNIVLPIVLKGTIRLPEAHLLVFVVIMGTAFGVLGVFIAPPVFAVLHYLYREAYVPWIEGRARRPG